MKKTSIFILLSIALYSCGVKEKVNDARSDSTEIKQTKLNSIKSENKKSCSILSNKYNAVANWDSSELYTYQIQDLFLNKNNIISFIGYISDIEKIDTIYLLKLYALNFENINMYIADVKISASAFEKFKTDKVNREHFQSYCFIFKVNSIVNDYQRQPANFSPESERVKAFLNPNQRLVHFSGDFIDFYKFQEEVVN